MNIATFSFSRAKDERIDYLKVSLDCEKKLVNEYALERSNIVLFIEHQHCFFVVNRIYSAK